jgi:hypothetical protein
MLHGTSSRSARGAVAVALLLLTQPVQAQSRLERDVGTAIDRGLTYLANIGAYDNPSALRDGSGLALLALLEKRIDNVPYLPIQGYARATAAEQARLRSAAAYILDRAGEAGYYAYRDGSDLMALSVYAVTGGPDKGEVAEIPASADYETIVQVMNRLTDRIVQNIRNPGNAGADPVNHGYTCYTNAGCEDSSTTLFAVAGLSAAKSFYLHEPYVDLARVAAINAELARSRTAFALNGVLGSSDAACAVLSSTERGHGYLRALDAPSLQHTAAGIYVQLQGGATFDSSGVQAYMEWMQNRYRYTDLGTLGGEWSGLSHGYYLWISFKAMELIRQAIGYSDSCRALPTGALGPDDWGTLPADSSPSCPVREVHKDPALVARPIAFGPGGIGYYAEPATGKSQYFDYAHTILAHQCYDGALPIAVNDGHFSCNGAPRSWQGYDQQVYKLLVLERGVPQQCLDTDSDCTCDADDNCRIEPNGDQADRDGDGVGDVCDNCPDRSNPQQGDRDGNGIGDECDTDKCDLDSDSDVDSADIRLITALRGQRVPPATPRADVDENRRITVNDARACALNCSRPRCR